MPSGKPWMATVPVGAEPEERDVAVDVDPERPALSMIEDASAGSPTTPRPQASQQFVVALHSTCAVKVMHLHAASTSSFVNQERQLPSCPAGRKSWPRTSPFKSPSSV